MIREMMGFVLDDFVEWDYLIFSTLESSIGRSCSRRSGSVWRDSEAGV